MKISKRVLSLLFAVSLAFICVVTPVDASAANVTDPNSVNNSSSSAVIVGADIVVSATFPSKPSSDDGKVYLFELRTYHYGIPDGAQPVASCAAASSVSLSIPLDHNDGVPRLYNKFVYAVKRGGVWTLINNAQYVSNPEVLSTNKRTRVERPLKAMQHGNIANVCLNGAGDANPNYSDLHMVVYTDVRDSVCSDASCRNGSGDSHPIKANPINQYMLNANDDAGINALIADMTHYASVSWTQDYVIGNEVNERCWNYMPYCDWDTYVNKYIQAFRVCYTAIKANNACANVYTSIDQVWDKNANSFEYIDGKDFLSMFNTKIKQNGNIDWNLTIHPYPNPLYYPKFWDMSGVANGSMYTAQVKNDQVLTFLNLSAVTNVMTQSSYLSPKGTVRDIIISEIGMGSNAGVEAQAAALCASWAAFERNPYVTQYLYLEYDVNGFYPTLTGKARECYDAMGTPKEGEYMSWAMGVIGINDWSQVLR